MYDDDTIIFALVYRHNSDLYIFQCADDMCNNVLNSSIQYISIVGEIYDLTVVTFPSGSSTPALISFIDRNDDLGLLLINVRCDNQICDTPILNYTVLTEYNVTNSYQITGIINKFTNTPIFSFAVNDQLFFVYCFSQTCSSPKINPIIVEDNLNDHTNSLQLLIHPTTKFPVIGFLSNSLQIII